MEAGEPGRWAERWDRLVKTAVTGIRADAPAPAVLLDEVAVTTIAQTHAVRTVRLPKAVPIVAPPEAALYRLRHDHERLRPYLREWLIAAADRGYQVPAEDLPLLRRLSVGDPMLAVPAARFAGPRGWDLAAVRAEHPGEAEGLFRTGTAEDWRAYLRALRAHDTDRARELLEAEWWRPWASDLRRVTARERATLLRSFEVGLSLDDEPFLEAVLGGRIKRPAVVAAKLLAALPGSAYGERMARRALACVRLSGDRFVVEPPAEPDAAARRDRIDTGLGLPHHVSGGYRTADPSRLAQIVSATPLAVWRRRFGLSPAAIYRRAADADDGLRFGLYLAVVRQGDQEWAQAVGPWVRGSGDLAALRHPEDLARDLPGLRISAPSFAVVDWMPTPWPPALARQFWDAVLVNAFGRALPLDYEAQVRDALKGNGSRGGATRLNGFLEEFAYRRRMLAELAGGTQDDADGADESSGDRT